MLPVRVLLVDDDTLVRRAVRQILEAADDLEVVGEASDGDGAVRQAPQADVCLLYTSPSPRDVEESRMPSSA